MKTPTIVPTPLSTPCLVAPEWVARDVGGYARMPPGPGRPGRTSLHRIVMADVYGWAALQGKVVMHLCDNPPCYRLGHLRVVTQADNARDMWAKGRARPACRKGSANSRSKLSDEDVATVRAELAAGVPGLQLARRFGVHHKTIYGIRDGKRYTS